MRSDSTAAPRRRPGRRDVPVTVTGLGTALSLISMLALPWLRLEGPNVVRPGGPLPLDLTQPVDFQTSGHGSHSVTTWVLFTVAVLAAVGAVLLRGGAQIAATVVSGSSAGALVLVGVQNLVLFAFASSARAPATPDHAVPQPGFWLALAGFILIGVGAATAPRQRRRLSVAGVGFAA